MQALQCRGAAAERAAVQSPCLAEEFGTSDGRRILNTCGECIPLHVSGKFFIEYFSLAEPESL